MELATLLRSGKVPVGSALELGCGRGANACYLAAQGFAVTAADISATAVEAARRAAAGRGLTVDFRIADLAADPDLGGTYDFLFDRGAYHAVRLADAHAFLRLLAKVSRTGTRYLCLCGNSRERCVSGPPVVTEEELTSYL